MTLFVVDDVTTATATVQITVRGNQAPEVSLGTTPTYVGGGDEVSLTAAVTDPEGDGLTYAWTSSAGGSFDDDGALETTWTAPDAARQDQPVTLTLTVTDDGAGTRSTTQTLSLTVRANAAPAGSVSAQPETVLGGKDVQLTSNVADPESDALTYVWTSSGGGAFADASAANTRWTAPAAATADQTVTLTLTVTDTVGETAFSTDVTVRENQPPTVVLGSIVTEVNGGGSVPLLVAIATDPEDDTLTYAWTSDGGGSFDDAGAPDTFWIAPDATDADQTVMLTLTVTDDGAGASSTSVTVVVTVRAQSQLAVMVTADPTTVNGGGTVMLGSTVTGAVGTVSYLWLASGFGTLSSTSIPDPVWTAPPAISSDREVQIILEVLTLFGSATATVQVTVRGNQAPEVSATAAPASVAGGGAVTLDGTATDPEGDTLTYAWTSDGGGSFADAGALDTTWTAPPAARQDQPVTLTLTVTDDGAGTRSTTQTLSLTVRANEAPAGSVSAQPETVLGGKDVQLTSSVADPENDAPDLCLDQQRGRHVRQRLGGQHQVDGPCRRHGGPDGDPDPHRHRYGGRDRLLYGRDGAGEPAAHGGAGEHTHRSPRRRKPVPCRLHRHRPGGGHADLCLDQRRRGHLRRRRRAEHLLGLARGHRRRPDGHAHADGDRRRRGSTLRLRHGRGHREGAVAVGGDGDGRPHDGERRRDGPAGQHGDGGRWRR